MDSKIDIVIPWVNNNDKEWLKKKNEFLNKSVFNAKLATKNRFLDYGTLRYVLRSIEKNMPWINNVFLLTDEQKPEWLKQNTLNLVSHKEFIRGELPTFNSNVIMTNINHISNLSEKFIIFNDEFIVWNSTKSTDYFLNGLPVDSLIETGTVPEADDFFHISQNGVAIVNKFFNKRKILRKKPLLFFNWKYGIQALRTFISLPYGGFIGFQNQHLTIPYTKSDFNNAYKLCPEYFERTWMHRFRQLDDINEWTVRYIRNIRGDFKPGYMKGQFFTLSNFKTSIPKVKKSSKIIVINDDGAYNGQIFENVHNMLHSRFPRKSKYEK